MRFTILLATFLFIKTVQPTAARSRLPEASSTLLRMHRLYLQQPPHDTELYDLLQVSPNATSHEITKSYRRISRKYHPDKQRHRKKGQGEEDDRRTLERVRGAYEVLKQDSSRLPYHRYGLIDAVDAVLLLTGRSKDDARQADPALRELLLLMGYSGNDVDSRCTISSDKNHLKDNADQRERLYKDRVWLVAHNLAGTIRPVVEGTVSEAFLADLIASKCDRLKRLPLGAHIIRCVGRAYRFSGRRVLRRYHAHPKQFLRYCNDRPGMPHMVQTISTTALLDITDGVQGHWRRMKQVVNAAVASGKVILSEQKKQQINSEKKNAWIAYHWSDLGEPSSGFPEMDDVDSDDFLSEDNIRKEESRKAQEALLESMQVEALWQVSKIELDRIIRDACDLVLAGDGLFVFPSSKSTQVEDGWVGSGGRAISTQVGRVRAAAALVMLGDIMVQRSKAETAWME